MAKLGKLSVARHLAVGTTAIGGSVLALTGIIGGGQHDERFDAKQVVVTPEGEDGVRIREVVDQDFGTYDRHGYERIIPNDFGEPTDIEASSPDASDDLDVSPYGSDETRIRIGDADTTIDGQHRYVLSYTLPDAHLDSGELALDIIGTRETLETERFEIVVSGFELENTTCNVGRDGDVGGCELVADGDVYRVEVSPLEPRQGITIGGTIVGRTEPVEVTEPPLPERRDDNRLPLAAVMLPLSAGTGAAGYVIARRRGRNEVYAGGAADAAYGNGPVSRATPGSALPPPTGIASEPITPTTTSVRLVADEEMDELATIEFVPPTGVEPWLGAVVLRENIDQVTVGAWFSGLAAKGAIDIEKGHERSKTVTLRRGRGIEALPGRDRELLEKLFRNGPEIDLGKYDKDFAEVWREVRARQQEEVAHAGLWKRMGPAVKSGISPQVAGLAISASIMSLVFAGGAVAAASGWIASPLVAVVLGIVATAVVALASYRTLLPVRSAKGSAIALRTESFRRFLEASEGQHVEWAWKHGLVREYSAWAVALGAARAWEQALESSTVPPSEYSMGGPLIVYSMASSFTSSYTAPSSSGGGSGFSGGGFSGGSVGGGGGGGSSGSW